MKSAKFLLFVSLIFVCSCGNQPEQPSPAAGPAPAAQPTDNILGEMVIPADNPMTPAKIALGKQLFFDNRISDSGTMSCETCHQPDKGWTDGKMFSPKFDGSLNTRHTPTLYNVGYYRNWYWDGRATTLEGQVLAAWKGQVGADPDQIVAKLNNIEGYKTAFQEAMGGPATPDRVAQAIATFVRTIKSENAPWDRYEIGGDKTAVSADAIAGFEVFSSTRRANCTLCHLPPLYTDTLFHNVGVGYDKPNPDLGRGKILMDMAKEKGTEDKEADAMMGAFKTPTLRSITERAPYFHDGHAKTLEEAVDFMLKGGIRNGNVDEKLRPRNVKPQEREQILAFLRSLTPEQKPFEMPQLP